MLNGMMPFCSNHLDDVLEDLDMYTHLQRRGGFFLDIILYSVNTSGYAYSVAISLIGVLSEGQIFISSKAL